MNFITPVNITTDRSIDHNSSILLLGSCFAENIGKLLANSRFNIVINPTGILYNPISIAQILERLIYQKEFVVEDIFLHQGMWSSFYHHGSFSRNNRDEALMLMNDSFQIGCKQLINATHLIITFGSASVYEHNGSVVSNCHKLPAKIFNERILSVEEIVDRYKSLISLIKSINHDVKIIFTVSPVRYLGYGAHRGQINKSTLILAVSHICELTGSDYFPSYEIMMDELRDYRFYAKDMVHPSDVAVDYIYERFCNTHLTEEAISTTAEIEKINKSLSHRPLHPDSETYKLFKKKLSQQIAAIALRYPNIKF